MFHYQIVAQCWSTFLELESHSHRNTHWSLMVSIAPRGISVVSPFYNDILLLYRMTEKEKNVSSALQQRLTVLRLHISITFVSTFFFS